MKSRWLWVPAFVAVFVLTELAWDRHRPETVVEHVVSFAVYPGEAITGRDVYERLLGR